MILWSLNRINVTSLVSESTSATVALSSLGAWGLAPREGNPGGGNFVGSRDPRQFHGKESPLGICSLCLFGRQGAEIPGYKKYLKKQNKKLSHSKLHMLSKRKL
jgi:hypothetical protein